MTYYNEQDLRDDLTAILLEECKHKDVVKEDNLVYCTTCESYAPWWNVGEEDEYGDWETRYEVLKDLPTDELVERAKECKL